MSTILVVKNVDQEAAVEEVLESVATDTGRVHFLRLPSVRCLGSLIQSLNPMVNYGVEYTIDCLPENYDVSEVVEYAVDYDATRICLGISDRTLTGKARIDELTQSILLHDRISGDLVVGDDVIILEELDYGTQSEHE